MIFLRGSKVKIVSSHVKIAKNETTLRIYNSLQRALKTAVDGDIVTLLDSISTTYIFVPKNITLDLNGYTLNASSIKCLGSIVDYSEDNTGMLITPLTRLFIQKNNPQIPIKNGEGYQFFQVLKINEAILSNPDRYVFQPFIEPKSHALLLKGSESSGISIGSRVKGTNIYNMEYTSKLQLCSDELVFDLINSYIAETDRYSRMFTLTLDDKVLPYFTNHVDVKALTVIRSETGVEIVSNGCSITI